MFACRPGIRTSILKMLAVADFVAVKISLTYSRNLVRLSLDEQMELFDIRLSSDEQMDLLDMPTGYPSHRQKFPRDDRSNLRLPATLKP